MIRWTWYEEKKTGESADEFQSVDGIKWIDRIDTEFLNSVSIFGVDSQTLFMGPYKFDDTSCASKCTLAM